MNQEARIQRLIEYHDNELPEDESAAVRAELESDDSLRAELHSIRQTEARVKRLAEHVRPPADRVSQGIVNLQARVDRELAARRRRQMIAVVGVLTSAAAGVVLVVSTRYRGSQPIGTWGLVESKAASDPVTSPQPLRPNSLIHVPQASSGEFLIDRVGKLSVGQGSRIRTRERPDHLALIDGSLTTLEVLEPIRLTLEGTAGSVEIRPGSFLRVRYSNGTLTLSQEKGESVLHIGDHSENIRAPARRERRLRTDGQLEVEN